MLTYPAIDPVAFALGPLKVHWYGLAYLSAFAVAWLLGMRRAGMDKYPLKRDHVDDLIFYGAMGVVLGGRMGYVLFYNFDKFIENPLWLFYVWEGGMSFHGGLIGSVLAMYLYARSIKIPFPQVMDFVAPLIPLGLFFGRVANFIGQELWGRETDGPWGMIFPKDPEQLVRHPSQLYEGILEGLVLFVILYWYSAKPRPRLVVSALFLVFYGIFRFIVEFARQPDSHLGFVAFGWMSQGQLLTLPMVFGGLAIIAWSIITKQPLNNEPVNTATEEKA